MNQVQSSFSETTLIKLKDKFWLDRQRIAGKVAADAITLLQNEVSNKTTNSLIELNIMAENFILGHNGCSLTFKGYKGFPTGVCISENNKLVHGIPSNYKLQNGDLVSFDLGVTYEGAIADTAVTCIYGQAKCEQHIDLINICQNSLYEAIKSIKIGKQLGCIGHTIHKYVTSKSNFKVISNYGGHGLDYNIAHAPPFVSNKSKYNEGVRIQQGLSIAIEPLLAVSSNQTRIDNDKWTVLTENVNSHTEHSIFVHQDSVEIITWRNNEQGKCANRLYFN